MKPIRIFIGSAQGEFAEEPAVLRDYVRDDALIRRFFDAFLFENVPASGRITSIWTKLNNATSTSACSATNKEVRTRTTCHRQLGNSSTQRNTARIASLS